MGNLIKDKSKKLNLGFTLLELLIVISIIGVLIALGTVSYTTAQKKSRDARRKMDLKNIQTAMESFYAQYGFYAKAKEDVANKFSSGQLPLDPKTGENYDWTGLDSTSGSGYCICTAIDLEIQGSGNATGRSSLSNLICDFKPASEAPRRFCVQNLQ